jgi:large subunit ribosomal protein L17
MRHGDKVNNLGRKSAHRKALLKNLSIALIAHKRINTTLAKAKALRVHLEPLVTKAKSNTMHARRTVFSYLQNKESIKELFGTIAEKVGDRPGGYLRIIKTGFRQGDAAEMAMIEFVDFNEVYNTQDQADDKKRSRRSRRSRRGGSGDQQENKGAAAATVATAAAATATAVVAEEEE